MKLYAFPPSPNARKVLIGLAEADLEADLQLVDLFAGDQMKPEYLKLNPNHLMPTLVDGDFVLWESNAILQYIGAKKPESGLWPSDPRRQADVSRWQCWQLAHWGPACGTLTFQNLVKGLTGGGDPDPAEVAKGEESFKRYAAVLNDHLEGRRFVAADQHTAADIAVGVWLTYCQPGKFPLQEFAEIRRWYDSLEARPGWKKAAPPPLTGQ